MHNGDGRYPAHGLVEGLARFVRVRPARLDPQQRRHRLQVVLDPVVDLPDRRILRDELAFLVAQLRHITTQHDRADALTAITDRDRAQ